MISKLHEEAGTLAGKKCLFLVNFWSEDDPPAPLCLSAAPSEDGDQEGIQGGHKVLCLPAPPSSHACPGAGAAA